MKEREQILDLWRDVQTQGTGAVLVTVVKTLGSSYRRPGARLLIAEGGRRAGSISGGCLEDDVVKKAWWLSEKGPVVRRYDTTPDGEIGPSGELSGGFGLGCNGIIYLLIQRLRAGEASALDLLANVHAMRQQAVLAHVLAPADLAGTFSRSQMPVSATDVFLETLNPPVRLLIFGAGDDAVPLTELARQLGWQVCVFDGRAHYARGERFPAAQQVSVRDPSLSLDDLQMDSRTVAVIMTHSYAQDVNFLRALVKHCLPYVGVLGPRNRSEQLMMDAQVAPADALSLHGPAGLDIGADGPEQVALSILAEIQACLNGREGGPLRERAGSIHSRESDGRTGAPFVAGVACA